MVRITKMSLTLVCQDKIIPQIPIKTTQSQARLWKGIIPGHETNLLQEIQFQQEVVHMMGKRHTPRRLTSYQGEVGTTYRYSGETRPAGPWTPHLLKIKKQVETLTGQSYTFALVNYYPDGDSSLGWHSDDERDLVGGSIIASVSFGATRDFQVRLKAVEKGGKPGEIITIPLGSGDLLTMEGNFQREFKHSVPCRKTVKTARINITFRQVVV
jgi:alkylated DNA repair dioxygenase AlkB